MYTNASPVLYFSFAVVKYLIQLTQRQKLFWSTFRDMIPGWMALLRLAWKSTVYSNLALLFLSLE